MTTFYADNLDPILITVYDGTNDLALCMYLYLSQIHQNKPEFQFHQYTAEAVLSYAFQFRLDYSYCAILLVFDMLTTFLVRSSRSPFQWHWHWRGTGYHSIASHSI